MKKLLTSALVASLVLPAAAIAAPASQALSIKSAAVAPVRASAKDGKSKVAPVLLVVGIAAVAGGVAAVASSGGGNDSR